MTIRCPICASNGLKIVEAVELGRNPPAWDERAIQRCQCATCQSRFISYYRERRCENGPDLCEHQHFTTSRNLWQAQAEAFQCHPLRGRSYHWRIEAAQIALAAAQNTQQNLFSSRPSVWARFKSALAEFQKR